VREKTSFWDLETGRKKTVQEVLRVCENSLELKPNILDKLIS
jgi:hypothetical protein